MKSISLLPAFPSARTFLFRCVRCGIVAAVVGILGIATVARAAEAGVVSGTVSNTATGNLLEGARIDVPQLGLSVLTDNTGRYVLTNVPAGTHEVVVSYIGLDAAKSQIVIGAGQRVVRNFDLTTSIYQLDVFKVTGEREGGAAAITAQRNADNLKNVVAMDSFGNHQDRAAIAAVGKRAAHQGSAADQFRDLARGSLFP